MLIPRARFHSELVDGQEYFSQKYYVWSEEDCGFIENKFFTYYDTKEECQSAIDMFNSFHIVQIA